LLHRRPKVRENSLVWSYKYADAEFGGLQARDLLQHLRTGPISNAPVDIVQVPFGDCIAIF
jgi:trehalose 6-phosphate synthase/phosphatase